MYVDEFENIYKIILITYYKYLKPIVNINSFTYLCIKSKKELQIELISDKF